jgi:hypothetical protein
MMSERDFPLGEPGVINDRFGRDPQAVIADYFLHVERPTFDEMNAAAGLIEGPWEEVGRLWQQPEPSKTAINMCLYLAARIPEATTVVAGMFEIHHEAIPKKWHDPKIARTILTNIADMEGVMLRSYQRSIDRGPAFSGLPERLAEVERFMDALQD